MKLLIVIAVAAVFFATPRLHAQPVQPFGVTNYLQGNLLYFVALQPTNVVYSFWMERSSTSPTSGFSSNGFTVFPTHVDGKPAWAAPNGGVTGYYRLGTQVSGTNYYSTNLSDVFKVSVRVVSGNREVAVDSPHNAGRAYRIEATASLPPSWSFVFSGIAGQTNFVDSATVSRRYYRVSTGP